MKFLTPTDHPKAAVHTHGVITEGPLLYISGQVPRRPDEGPVATDPTDQIRQIFRNIGNILETAGATPSDIVHLRVYLAGKEVKEPFATARAEFLGDHRPALTCIMCEIWDDAWVAEIEAVAEVPKG